MIRSQRITPCLWLDGNAEAAAKLYTSLFANSHIGRVSHYGKEGYEHHRQPEGRVMTLEMEIAGTQLMALNGGPMFKLNPSISLFVMLETEATVDKLWAGLADGGAALMPLDTYPWSRRYGWLNDRFGVSWQIGVAASADIKRTITPFMMFTPPRAGEAEAAMKYYTSIFPNSTIDRVLRHAGAGPDTAGSVQHGTFRLDGEQFMAMDSAHPHPFGFNEALSFVVTCANQDEVDGYWRALLADGGTESMCGWIKDRFGVSWQIVPEAVARLMSDPDRAAAGRVMTALLGMRKLDVAALERASRGN